MLRIELAFYLGCLNLRERLDAKGEPACFPTPLAAGQLTLAAESIYDVCLTLHLPNRVVGNDVNADGRSLVMITGANQGGKSTLLRSLGLAHLMMQSGMFVGAQSFRGSTCAGVFTHHKREEDATMQGGKLDEELARMSEIAGQITANSILLCNESFAATNEREGSEIARQVVRAMLDRRQPRRLQDAAIPRGRGGGARGRNQGHGPARRRRHGRNARRTLWPAEGS